MPGWNHDRAASCRPTSINSFLNRGTRIVLFASGRAVIFYVEYLCRRSLQRMKGKNRAEHEQNIEDLLGNKTHAGLVCVHTPE